MCVCVRACVSVRVRARACDFISFAFITGNSGLEPLLEVLLAQLHMDLSLLVCVFIPNLHDLV